MNQGLVLPSTSTKPSMPNNSMMRNTDTNAFHSRLNSSNPLEPRQIPAGGKWMVMPFSRRSTVASLLIGCRGTLRSARSIPRP